MAEAWRTCESRWRKQRKAATLTRTAINIKTEPRNETTFANVTMMLLYSNWWSTILNKYFTCVHFLLSASFHFRDYVESTNLYERGHYHKALLVLLMSTMDSQLEMTCKHLSYLWLLFHLSNDRTIMAMICQRGSFLSFMLIPMQTNSINTTPYTNIELGKPGVFACVMMSSLHNQNQVKFGFIDLKGVKKLQMIASCQTGRCQHI